MGSSSWGGGRWPWALLLFWVAACFEPSPLSPPDWGTARTAVWIHGDDPSTATVLALPGPVRLLESVAEDATLAVAAFEPPPDQLSFSDVLVAAPADPRAVGLPLDQAKGIWGGRLKPEGLGWIEDDPEAIAVLSRFRFSRALPSVCNGSTPVENAIELPLTSLRPRLRPLSDVDSGHVRALERLSDDEVFVVVAWAIPTGDLYARVKISTSSAVEVRALRARPETTAATWRADDGRIWLVGDDGVLGVWDPGSDTYARVADGPGEGSFRRLDGLGSEQPTLWAAGLADFAGDQEEVSAFELEWSDPPRWIVRRLGVPTSGHPIINVAVGGVGAIVTGASHDLLVLRDGQVGLEPTALPEQMTSTEFLGLDEEVWIAGSDGSGLVGRWPKGRLQTPGELIPLSAGRVLQLAEWGSTIIIAGTGGWLELVEPGVPRSELCSQRLRVEQNNLSEVAVLGDRLAVVGGLRPAFIDAAPTLYLLRR